ncbi:MAG: AarF/ABC1/UbiB kinase family protein [Actinobacteria bacterium]|nr:ABC1 family protein [Leifsonia aquatica ATCC 14665]MBN9630533.1 AarF/ABC1/UbiB kinase family protein [Actinomycetota bacterium]
MTPSRNRYRLIASVLERHGLGLLVGALGLQSWVPFNRGILGHERRDDPYTNPEHLRLALEDLGPTFIKLGQLLSTRTDLLPSAYTQELVKLQDAAPPVRWEEIGAVIQEELGAPAEELFETFDTEPLAAASIGQAHAATLHGGTQVVVKVRRPGAVAQIAEDLEILQNLAHRLDRRWEGAQQYNIPGLVEEFSRTLRAELDYLQEGRNAERFAANFEGSSDVQIPRIFWETTTSRVLTLERMRGIRIDDVEALDADHIDRHQLARRGSDNILRMVFEHQFFHADPHPGNMFVQPDGSIALIDFGMVGSLGARVADQLARVLRSFAEGDSDEMTDAVIDLSVTKSFLDRQGLRDSLALLIAGFRGHTLAEANLTHFLTRLLGLLREHHLQLPQETALLFKVLMIAQGVATRLDPQFDMIQAINPFVERFARRQFSLSVLGRRLAESSSDVGAVLLELPATLRNLRRVLDAGGFEVHLRARELEPLVRRSERIGNRLVAGLIAAALINGISGLASGPAEWRQRRAAMIGTGAGLLSALAGYLLWTARRGR